MKVSNFIKTMLVGILLMLPIQAQALSLVPGDADYNGNGLTLDPNTSTSKILDYLSSTYSLDLSNLLYKAEAGSGAEEGSFQNYYDTVFSNTTSDPSDATISHIDGTPYISGTETYLLVKDGNHDPWWYFFDISGLWDGMEDIVLTGFWPNGGAISQLSIFGDSPAPVPEPATMLLFGVGLAGIASRRLRKK